MDLPRPSVPFRLTTGAAAPPFAPPMRAITPPAQPFPASARATAAAAPTTPPAPPAPLGGDGIPLHPTPEAAHAAMAALREEFIRSMPRVAPGAVAGMTESDLARLFGMYDRQAFAGRLTRRLAERGAAVPAFRFSRRLTSAAGRTIRRDCRAPAADRGNDGAPPRPREHWTIEISVPLLLGAFDAPATDVRVGGLVCRDLLDVLLRVFEHELVHLLEMAHRDATDCGGPDFHFLASRIVGHVSHFHGLPTARDRVHARLGLSVGDEVAFPFRDGRLVGRIASIRRRATVVVERACPDGGPPHATKFGVPIELLERVDGAQGA